jgi:rRNA-processing protein FCF1
LFLPIRSGFPLEAEVARFVPGARILIAESGIRELDRLVDRATPSAAGARALAEKFARTPARAEGDEAVVEVALRERAIVVTSDRGLQERLRRSGISILVPRDRHRLELRPARAPRSPRTPVASLRNGKTSKRRPARGNR